MDKRSKAYRDSIGRVSNFEMENNPGQHESSVTTTPQVELMNEINSTSEPVKSTVKLNDSANDIKFFGEIDRDEKGKIISVIPAWSQEQHIEKEKEEISKIKGSLAAGLIPQQTLQDVRNRLAELEENVSKKINSKPNLDGKQIDIVAESLKELGVALGQSMPSKKEIRDNLVSNQKEYDRVTKPSIEIKNEALYRLAKECNVEIKNGRISGNGANLMYGILAKTIGSNPNVEYLRRN